ncbi:hypothetical protein ACP70R_029833 [Stipagrostis hirtigluma subsp. patula]
MAAAHQRLRFSFRVALLLSLLLPSMLLLQSLAAAPDAEAPAASSGSGKPEEGNGHSFDLCKLTGPFRFQLFGVVIECPDPSFRPSGGPGGIHQPPVSPAGPRGKHQPPVRPPNPNPGGIQQPPVSPATAMPQENAKGTSDEEKGKTGSAGAGGKKEGKDEL